MTTFSLCMIVKDEEKYLGRCLSSVKDYVDEIIIVDTGSSDDTKAIAKKFTDKVFDFKWSDNFSDARNFSISKATKEWIIVIDADEVISKKDMEEIKLLIEDTDFDGFYLIQRNYTNNSSNIPWVPNENREEKFKGYIPNPILRVFRNNSGFFYMGSVHETLDNSAKQKNLKISTLLIPIHHYFEEKDENSLAKRQLKYLEIAESNLKEKEDGRMYATAGVVCLRFKKDYVKAREYLQKASDLGYKKNECLEGVAEAFIGMEDYESAYSIYKEMAKSGYLSSSLCNNLANILVIYKHYKQALKFLRIALAQGNPNKERIMKNIETVERALKEESK